MSIQLYDVDLLTRRYTLLQVIESDEHEIAPFFPVEKQEYAVNNEDAPFDTIRLLKTGLATNLRPMLKGSPYDIYDYTCYTNGNAIGHGASPDLGALSLDDLPEEFSIELSDGTTYHLSSTSR